VPLLVIPAGTRNHFGGFGIADLDVAEASRGCVRHVGVDLGNVNDRRFINNSSIGAYAALVREREVYERRFSKRVASLIATAKVLRRGRPVEVVLDGEPQAVWLVFVGNGRYGDDLSDLASRESLDGNVLDVRVIRAERRFTRLLLLLQAITGRLGGRALGHPRSSSNEPSKASRCSATRRAIQAPSVITTMNNTGRLRATKTLDDGWTGYRQPAGADLSRNGSACVGSTPLRSGTGGARHRAAGPTGAARCRSRTARAQSFGTAARDHLLLVDDRSNERGCSLPSSYAAKVPTGYVSKPSVHASPVTQPASRAARDQHAESPVRT